MKLKEWIEENKDKEIAFDEDGKLYIPETKSNVWTPKNGEKYSHIGSDGVIYTEDWNEEDDFNQDTKLIGNCFPTVEEAKKTVEVLKIRTELMECGGSTVFDPDGWGFGLNVVTGEIEFYEVCDIHCPFDIYFKSVADLKNSIQKVGEERLKKYLFGI